MAYDPCAPSVPASPVSAPIHHHYVHRIVGRIRPRRAAIHKIAAHPINPDGCAQPTAGALNTPRPSGLAAGGLGAGKIASAVGIGGAAVIGGPLLPPSGSHTSTPTTPVSVTTSPSDPGTTTNPGTPVPITPIIVPPTPPTVVVPSGPTGPVPVPEPATLVIFAMALAALWLARTLAARRLRPQLAH